MSLTEQPPVSVGKDSVFSGTEPVKVALGTATGEDHTRWKIADGGVFSYQDSFSCVLADTNLPRLVGESIERGGKAYVLDLMGYGRVLRDLPLLPPDGGLAVALGDPRTEETRARDRKRNITLQEGNILKKSTWNRIEEWLQKQEADDKKFDLILCRPVGGLYHLGFHKGAFIPLLQRAWSLLSGREGRFLTQLPRDRDSDKELFDNALMKEWVTLLNKTPGVQAVYAPGPKFLTDAIVFYSTLSLIKRSGAPARLPLL